LAEEDKSDWENLPEFITTLQDWDAFKEALFREYPSARKPFVSSANLDVFAKEKSKQEILTLDNCQERVFQPDQSAIRSGSTKKRHRG